MSCKIKVKISETGTVSTVTRVGEHMDCDTIFMY